MPATCIRIFEHFVPFNSGIFEDFDYMVHAVGFGIRYRTPSARFVSISRTASILPASWG